MQQGAALKELGAGIKELGAGIKELGAGIKELGVEIKEQGLEQRMHSQLLVQILGRLPKRSRSVGDAPRQ